MIALIITNIILAFIFGLNAILCLVDDRKNNRPIIIKEAKALRSYYEKKLEDAEREAEEAKRNYAEYKGLYNHELEIRKEVDKSRRESDDIERRNSELKLRVINLEGELCSCTDRIEAMARENDELKKKIKELSKPAKKGKNGRAKV